MAKAACRQWAGPVRRILAGALVAMGSAGLPGCYQYVRVEPESASPGSRVRAELSVPAAVQLAEMTERDAGRRVEGRLVEISPDGALLLEVSRSANETPVGVTARPLFSRVSLRPDDLLALELKKLDRKRTALTVGGGALLAGILVKVAFDTYGGDGEGQGPPVDEAIIPIFSIRW